MVSNMLTLWVWEVWFVITSHWVCNGRRACDVRMVKLSTRFNVVDLKSKC
jgi:hypothetical protein